MTSSLARFVNFTTPPKGPGQNPVHSYIYPSLDQLLPYPCIDNTIPQPKSTKYTLRNNMADKEPQQPQQISEQDAKNAQDPNHPSHPNHPHVSP